MCFSTTASFSVAATLAPVAAFALHRARREPRWLALAAFPLAFGIQQFAEGLLWAAIEAKNSTGIALASRGFVLFSHFFWPAWVPFSVYRLETNAVPWRRNALKVLSVLGLLFGLTIALPSLVLRDWLSVEIAAGSIEYVTRMLYDGFISRQVLKLVYGAIVVGSLLLSRDKLVKVFGAIVLTSLLVADAYFGHAFVSIWCFFAAVLSVYIAVVITVRANGNRRGRQDTAGAVLP